MTKVTIIGAGSIQFTRTLCNDILLTPSREGCTISLMDIDTVRLEHARSLVQALINRRGLKNVLQVTQNQREAVAGADYVITTFQQGGLDAYEIDIDIPARYGVGQCIGDTLGPGGVFRALRTIPVMVNLTKDLEAVSPNALLLNYVNPMAAVCWGVWDITGWPLVGLCHSVQETSEMLAEWVDLPLEEITYLCVGLNHFAFFMEFQHRTANGKRDLYPQIWEAIENQDVIDREPVRVQLMKAFGYFCTEASGHNSEYLPYFRKSERMIDALVPQFKNPAHHYWFDYGRTGGYLRYCQGQAKQYLQEYEDLITGKTPLPKARSMEYGADIIEAIETDRPFAFNGNVPNDGLVDNLPKGCCVELPCMVDGNGARGVKYGSLPVQLAAVLRTNINVQEMIVHAAKTCSRDAVHQAVLLDPLTSAVCTLPQIHAMVDEMLSAQAAWLPQFS